MQLKVFIYVLQYFRDLCRYRPLNKQRIIKANMISLIQDNRD